MDYILHFFIYVFPGIYYLPTYHKYLYMFKSLTYYNNLYILNIYILLLFILYIFIYVISLQSVTS